MDELLEIETTQSLSREEAADLLRRVADSLARHNEVEFKQNGTRYHVKVPDQVEVELELEIESDGGSLEIELSW
jgi:amphi-Trp domain-containing protein